MRRFPKIASLLSLILLISILCQPISAAAQPSAPNASDNDPTFGDQDSSITVNSTPNPEGAAEDPLLAALYDCIDKGEESVTYESKTRLSDEYTASLLSSLLDEYPEFFYLDQISLSFTARVNADGSLDSCIYRFKPIYTLSSQKEIAAAKAEWLSMLSEVLKCIKPTMTDFEKALFLHDYLCANFGYDATLTVSDSYTFLKGKVGVCEAYADTYSALLTALGIPNRFAVSDEMNHVWNVIKIDGLWYHVDVTWDDPLNEQMLDQPGKVLHTAFMRSDEGMQEAGHKNWTCDVICTSEIYENYFLPDLIGSVVTDGEHLYAVNGEKKSLIRCDFNQMISETLIDLSSHRWYVWGEPFFWNACFSNLYCDGEWLYYSTPVGIEAYDLASGEIIKVCTYDKGDGYLYSMRYENHQLICTVSTTPGIAEGEFVFNARHRYAASAVDGIFVTSNCIECGDTAQSIAPLSGETFALAASARPTAEANKAHDIRLVMTVESTVAKALGKLEYTFLLERADGSTDTLVFHSENDDFSEFQRYETLSAGDRLLIPAPNHLLLGFYISAIEDESWSKLSFQIAQLDDQTVLCERSLRYDQLIA